MSSRLLRPVGGEVGVEGGVGCVVRGSGWGDGGSGWRQRDTPRGGRGCAAMSQPDTKQRSTLAASAHTQTGTQAHAAPTHGQQPQPSPHPTAQPIPNSQPHTQQPSPHPTSCPTPNSPPHPQQPLSPESCRCLSTALMASEAFWLPLRSSSTAAVPRRATPAAAIRGGGGRSSQGSSKGSRKRGGGAHRLSAGG